MVRNRGENAWQERVVVAKRSKLLGLFNGMIDAARSSLLDRYTTAVPRETDLWTTSQLPSQR